jgi:hypothetical protein
MNTILDNAHVSSRGTSISEKSGEELKRILLTPDGRSREIKSLLLENSGNERRERGHY